MAVDWARIEREYSASTFDRAHLNDMAQRAAEALSNAGVPFDGYTDTQTTERRGLLRTLFTAPGIEHKHIGYWEVESDWYSRFHQDRKKTRVETLNGHWSTQLQEQNSQGRKWALLDGGVLALFERRDFAYRHMRKDNTTRWREMTEADVLLLDRRPQRWDRDYRNASGIGHEHGEMYGSDRPIATNSKGNGLRKRLRALREKHGVAEQGPARPPGTTSAVHPARPPLTATYTLLPRQLESGCTITHTFANGTKTSVTIRPQTRSGKIINVRSRGGGGAEAIKVVVGY
jgi:hypothetical protein